MIQVRFTPVFMANTSDDNGQRKYNLFLSKCFDHYRDQKPLKAMNPFFKIVKLQKNNISL